MKAKNKLKEKVENLVIGKKIKQLRDEHAWSREELAERSKVDIRTIQRLENGDKGQGHTLRSISEAFNISIQELTRLKFNNGNIIRMTPQEVQILIGTLNELLESGRINRMEYQEVEELIRRELDSQPQFSLPPLPPPPDSEMNSISIEPTRALEKMDFVEAIKHVVNETTPWVRYAPSDKNKPTIAHQLREQGFIHHPYISNWGRWRIGLFFTRYIASTDLIYSKSPFYHNNNLGILYLVVSDGEKNEGLVVRLWKTPRYFSYSQYASQYKTVFYRSENQKEGLFNIDLTGFKIENDHKHEDYEISLLLLDAIQETNPNYELTGAWLKNTYEPFSDTYDWKTVFKFNPARLIKVGEFEPIYIPWNINIGTQRISLEYNHPIKPLWYGNYLKWTSLKIDIGEHWNNKIEKYHANSRLLISWPDFNKFESRILAILRHRGYKNLVNTGDVDLITQLDESIFNNKKNDIDREN